LICLKRMFKPSERCVYPY